MGKYEDNLERIRKAVRCEEVDRIPVASCGNAYYARTAKLPMKEYITDFDKACDANLAEQIRIDADATQNVIFSPYLLGTQWLSKTALPGKELVSPAMIDEFVWPSFVAYYDLCVEMNVIPIFHLDSSWTLVLDKFKEFKPGTFVMALDSKTDIRKTREVLGKGVCILGDVPCELMTYGTPEEVSDYVTKLLDDIGPWGVIIATGCDIPSDAKPENVLAMSQAAHDYLEIPCKKLSRKIFFIGL